MTSTAAALDRFISEMNEIVAREGADERAIVGAVDDALRKLIAQDDWLDEARARPHPVYYQQYLLHADPLGRYSVVSFVWGPGQRTPIHDHCTWGVIGMLRGAEIAVPYRVHGGQIVQAGEAQRLLPGDTGVVSPTLGDIHAVSNAHEDRVSISIHVYGADIGRHARHVYDPDTGVSKTFISGYSSHSGYTK